MGLRASVFTAALAGLVPAAAAAQPLSFAAPREYDAGTAAIVGSAVGDFDADGHPDLSLTARDAGGALALRLFLASADGTLRPAPVRTLDAGRGDFALGDFTGDGRLDVVVDAGGIAVLPGQGDGTFGAVIRTGGYGWQVVAADFNGDGRLDIASGGDNTIFGPPETIDVYLGNGDGTFGAFRTVLLSDTNPRVLSAGDLNGDGNADLLLSQPTFREVVVYLNDGTATFTSLEGAFAEPGSPRGGIADLSRDGRADVVTANNQGSVSVFPGTGDGTLQAGRTYPVGDCSGTTCPSPAWVALADMNGDESIDVVTANRTPGSASLLFNDGAGTLESAMIVPVRAFAHTVAVADFNRDGKPDLAVTNSDVDASTDGPRFVSVLLQTSGADASLQPVNWTELVNAGVFGTALRKTGGCDGCYDAGASAAQTLEAGAGAVEFTVVDPAMRLRAGLSATAVERPGDMAFGLQLQGNGWVEVRERGVYRADTRIAAGDVLRAAVDEAGVVTYAKNGAVFHTSTRAAAWPLSFVALLASSGASLADARIAVTDGSSPPPPPPPPPDEDGWESQANVTAAEGAITKTSGCHGCFDAYARSDGRIDGDGGVAFTTPDSGAVLLAGLARLSASATVSDVDFGLLLQGGGWMEVRERGVYRTDVMAAPGDRFSIAVTNDTVTYLRNGIAFYTSTAVPAYPLQFVVILASAGASIQDVAFEGSAGTPPPPADAEEVVWIDRVHVTAIDSRLSKTSGCDGCFDAAASSEQQFAEGAGVLEFTVVDPTAVLAIGLTDVFVGTAPHQIAFAIQVQGGGWAEVREHGVYRADVRVAAGDVFQIAISGGSVTYAKNGVVFHTSAAGGPSALFAAAALADAGGSIDRARLREF